MTRPTKMRPTKMRRVVVTGMGVVSSLGDSPASLHAALVKGESGVRPVSLFETDGLGPLQAAEVPDFAPESYLGRVNLRPVDRTARLVIVASHLAFEQSGWTREMREEKDVGLVLGTMFGSVHTISAFDRRALVAGPSYAKPFDFANSVINAAAGQTAIWHALRGINSTVAGGTTAGLQALAYAAEQIRTGRSDALLAGGADELCFESMFGFHKSGRLSPQNGGGAGIPFDARRDGMVLGEGAGLLMLEEASAAMERGAPILAEIRGHANCYDCSRGNDERAPDAVRRAIGLALADAGVDGSEITAIGAAANGSIAGDRHEAEGLAAAFTGAQPPVAATKSMLGETLGASGALAAISMLEALQAGVLPGIRGFERAGEGIDGGCLSSETREIDGSLGLIDAVGLDGNVCALIVERLGPGELAERLAGAA